MNLIVSDLPREALCIREGDTLLTPESGGLAPCTGCFGCWIRTPGQCLIADAGQKTGALLGQARRLILVSRCIYGSYSVFVKRVLDRAISYVHPCFTFRYGEMHHRHRYENCLLISAYLYGDDLTTGECETARLLLRANAENLDGVVERVMFCRRSEELRRMVL